jgi:hypothetical protein
MTGCGIARSSRRTDDFLSSCWRARRWCSAARVVSTRSSLRRSHRLPTLATVVRVSDCLATSQMEGQSLRKTWAARSASVAGITRFPTLFQTVAPISPQSSADIRVLRSPYGSTAVGTFDRDTYVVRTNPYVMPVFFIGTPAHRLKQLTVRRAPSVAIEDSRLGLYRRSRPPKSWVLFHD